MQYLSENDKKILELETRRKIYQTVKKYAGSHFREIQRKSGLAVGTVQHHLHALVKSGLVKEIKKGNNLVYFPREFESENTALLGLLRQESIRKIVLFIMLNKNCNHEQIVKYINLSPSTISWHLKKLQQEKIITADKKGRKTFYRLALDEKEIANLLLTYQESFVDTLVDRVIEMWSFE
jgi:predicted transcriptional regulator